MTKDPAPISSTVPLAGRLPNRTGQFSMPALEAGVAKRKVNASQRPSCTPIKIEIPRLAHPKMTAERLRVSVDKTPSAPVAR